MTQKDSRINFKNGVRETLFKRAEGKCSVPRCKRPTMGPFPENEGAVNMGVACHIYSAAENGPRGRDGKSEDFISSEKNGIWCCQYHAGLIDKKKGDGYPAATLFAWKALIEARTQKKMNDVPSPLGWVDSCAITNFPIKDVSPKLELSRWTLFTGRNCVGKTALLEFVASISNAKYAERFTGYSDRKFEAEVIYTTVDDFDKKSQLKIVDGYLSRYENDNICLLPPGDIEVIYSNENELQLLKGEDHIDLMKRVLNVDHAALMTLCNIGTKTLKAGEIKFEQGTVEHEWDEDQEEPRVKNENWDPFMELMFKEKGHDKYLSFDQLAKSTRAKLILDLQITKARETAKQRLTLLLVEDYCSNFDKGSFEELLRAIQGEDFQVIVSLPYHLNNEVIAEDGKLLQDKDYLSSWQLRYIS